VRRPAHTSGFTLVEVIVGLAVGGVVLLAGFTALATVQDRSVHAQDATMGVLEGATARATLIEWLATAVPTAAGPPGAGRIRIEGLDAREMGLPSDELTFPTQGSTTLRIPVTVVRLFIDSDPETPERGLVAELSGRLGESATVELVPRATGLLIRYLPMGDGAVQWTESWVGQTQLPRAVELTLLEDPSAPLPPLLRLPVRVPMADVLSAPAPAAAGPVETAPMPLGPGGP